MKHLQTPSFFDAQRAPAPGWTQQGNPLFESRAPLPLERAAGCPAPLPTLEELERFRLQQEAALNRAAER